MRARTSGWKSAVGTVASSLLFLVGFATPALAIDAALAVGTSSLGVFPGENTTQGREGTIEILGYADALATPFNTSGQATGAPECRPLVIRKLVDRTSPLFANAWGNTETFLAFELRMYKVGLHYFTVELTNARISAISRAGGELDPVPSEQISFVFQSVEYSHEDGGIVHAHSCTGL